MPKMRVHVRQDICTGEALCTGISPRYFELITNAKGEHKALVKGRDGSLLENRTVDVNDDDYDEILDAAERCPPRAIFVFEVEDDGEEQLFP